MPSEPLSSEAESKGDYVLDEKNYEMLGKVVPGDTGEKIFLKLKEKSEKKDSKHKKKANIGSIISFLIATIFVALIM